MKDITKLQMAFVGLPAIVIAMLILPSVVGVAGSGTFADPYEITNCTELENISNMNLYAYYELTNDINCTDTITWNSGAGFTPINVFRGHFNGNNYSIDGIYMNRTAGNTGLFGTLGNGSISNFTITNFDIQSTGDDCGLAVGEILATGSPSALNQYNYIHHVKIEDSKVSCHRYMAGVAGQSYCVINIQGPPKIYIYNIEMDNVTVGPAPTTNCTVDQEGCAALMGTDVGGIMGYVYPRQQCTINFSYIKMDNVNITGGDRVGGLIGYYRIGESSYFTGNYHDFDEIYINGSITSAIGNVGGMWGYVAMQGQDAGGSPRSWMKPEDVAIHASITGTHDVGGAVGIFTGVENGLLRIRFEDVISTGLVSTHQAFGETIEDIGGFVGSSSSSNYPYFYDCFWDVNTSNQSTSAWGTGLSTAVMKTNTTYENFSTSLWNITNGSYPYLLRFPPPVIVEEEEIEEEPVSGGSPFGGRGWYTEPEIENDTTTFIVVSQPVSIDNWWQKLLDYLRGLQWEENWP